jgi:anaerobic selenocysteine-containing dehydrogenase
VDQISKQVASGYLFGTPLTVAVPDLDRTAYVLMLGANPYESNGSLCTAPDFPGRLEAIRARGGKVVVVDPKLTKTARVADEWLAIRPGTDGLFLAAIANELFSTGKVDVGDAVRPHVNGLAEVQAALRPFTPESVERATGISAVTIRRIAAELADAESACVYGRIGTTTVSFGTTTSWLVDVVNVITGNLDSPGGVMFPLPAAGSPNTKGTPGRGKGFVTGRGRTRVRGFPEALGELPSALMAEEMLTPGPGQVRALVTFAGNPLLSTPNSDQLERAMDDLEFKVSIDIYLNETTRHADVILPPPSHLERSHFDLTFTMFSVRNMANYSEPVFDRSPDQPDEWEILAKLAAIAQGLGPTIEPSVIDDLVIGQMVDSAIADSTSVVHGRDREDLLAQLKPHVGVDRVLDFLLRTGPYGDGFGARPEGLSLEYLRMHPHGVDLGALEPRVPEILRTPSGKIELAHQALVADLDRLRQTIHDVDESLLLIGRRHLRSNNSWMHNVQVLVKGKPRCTLQMHPLDAARAGISDGDRVHVRSRVGAVEVPVEITEDIRQSVVSLPHGWGHDKDGTRLRVAGEHAGVNSNVLTDHEMIDPLSGNAVLNGIPVTVSRL